jgi:phage terminase small subunit
METNEKEIKLTEKQEQFCQEYVIDFNATQAAIRVGYSEKTAKEIGYENLTKPHIIKRKNELIVLRMGEDREELQARTVNELKAIAFSNITSDINIVTKEKEVPVLDAEGNETGEVKVYVSKEVEINDTEDSPNKQAIASIEQNEKGVIKIKYHDKVKALEKIGQHVGLWEENSVVIQNISIGSPPKPEDADFDT